MENASRSSVKGIKPVLSGSKRRAMFSTTMPLLALKKCIQTVKRGAQTYYEFFRIKKLITRLRRLRVNGGFHGTNTVDFFRKNFMILGIIMSVYNKKT
jgi:hypothetical protein